MQECDSCYIGCATKHGDSYREHQATPVVDEYTARSAVAVLVSGHAGDHRHTFSQLSHAPLSLPKQIEG